MPAAAARQIRALWMSTIAFTIRYPKNVGAVGGRVGMIGGLGGFVLPIAFGALSELTGLSTSRFILQK